MIKAGRNTCELDSFFESAILIAIGEFDTQKNILQAIENAGFKNVSTVSKCEEFHDCIMNKKYDLILLSVCNDSQSDYSSPAFVRKYDADVAIITVSDDCNDQKKNLEYNIRNHFIKPLDPDNIVKAVKIAIGDKKSYEIGMQFFDALFGMQMCTHRDLHQRTFDHVIRTTQTYGQFLLYLTNKGVLDLTSWSLKNCLMASLVHDIGKLLIMHGVLYKDGKLTEFEYQQIKRHPWNSITALLGGQDIEFFANQDSPVQTVSGYNEKNLSAQAQKWIFKIFEDDDSSYNDIQRYFDEMSRKPFIHSLNKDLLYIVFRHHDGTTRSYHSDKELEQFSKIIGRPVEKKLDENSLLDVVTNALTICDMYDALMDVKRDYRKFAYTPIFALFLLYCDMKNGKFFPFLMELFIKFIINKSIDGRYKKYRVFQNSENAYIAIGNVYDLFKITPDQETDFNEFIISNADAFDEYSVTLNESTLIDLNYKWVDYFTKRRNEMIAEFYGQLEDAGLIKKEIKDFNIDEIKIFDMLYKFYYSYSSSMKRKRLIDYLKECVTDNKINEDVRKRVTDLIHSEDISNRKDFENLLKDAYEKRSIFEVFAVYDEEILINELNDFLRRQGY